MVTRLGNLIAQAWKQFRGTHWRTFREHLNAYANVGYKKVPPAGLSTCAPSFRLKVNDEVGQGAGILNAARNSAAACASLTAARASASSPAAV